MLLSPHIVAKVNVRNKPISVSEMRQFKHQIVWQCCRKCEKIGKKKHSVDKLEHLSGRTVACVKEMTPRTTFSPPRKTGRRISYNVQSGKIQNEELFSIGRTLSPSPIRKISDITNHRWREKLITINYHLSIL